MAELKETLDRLNSLLELHTEKIVEFEERINRLELALKWPASFKR